MVKSSATPGNLASTDECFAELVAEISERLQSGEAVGVESYLHKYPEHADGLRRLFPALRVLLDLGLSTHQGSLSAGQLAQGAAPESGILGDFRIFCEIGRGGMGVVYEAEQISLHRRVALKVLPFAAIFSKTHLERFKNEAQAAASLDHPGIVAIHSVGCERGVHYYAMQLVEGQSLAEVIQNLRRHAGTDAPEAEKPPDERSPLPEGRPSSLLTQPHHSSDTSSQSDPPATGNQAGSPPATRPAVTTQVELQAGITTDGSSRSPQFFRTAAGLGIQVAEALDHAHQHGIVHRDIKPANLLLDLEGHLRITDFGLARMASDASITLSGDLLGTLRYMSPEQALAKRAVVDHRTDVYSLGVTLYELLTLRPAFGGQDREALLRLISLEEPRPPRRINGSIPTDLETIVLKAMRKTPDERYTTAQALADDLKRFVEDRPIQARRPTVPQRLTKWSRRHIGMVVTATMLLLLATIGSAGSVALIRRAYQEESTQREIAEKNAQTAERLQQLADARAADAKAQQETTHRYLYAAHMKLAQGMWEEGNVRSARSLLLNYQPKPGQEDLRSFEWYYLWGKFHPERFVLTTRHYVYSVAFTPDGRSIVAGCGDRRVRVFDAVSGDVVALLECAAQVYSVAVSPDGRLAASGDRRGSLTVWDTSTWKENMTLEDAALTGTLPGVNCAFSPDSKTLAAFIGDSARVGVMLWDLETRQSRRIERRVGTGDLRSAVAFSPDGKTLATATAVNEVRLWDVASGQEFGSIDHPWDVRCVEFSPDGKVLAIGAEKGTILVNVQTRQQLATFPENTLCLAFSVDGGELATAGKHGTISLWNVHTGLLTTTLEGNTNWVFSVTYSPDGETLASAGRDGRVRVWALGEEHDERTVQGTAHHWGNTQGRDVERVTPLAFSPHNPDMIAIGGSSHAVKLLNARNGTELVSLQGQTSNVNSVAFSPKANVLASGSGSATQPGAVILWDLTAKEKLNVIDAHKGVFSSVAYSPDGKTLAAGVGKAVKLWNTTTGQLQTTLQEHISDVVSVAFSPDGTTLAAATMERDDTSNGKQGITRGVVKLWKVATGESRTLKIYSLRHPCVAFSPDGKVLAAAGWNDFDAVGGGQTTVWDVTTESVVAKLIGHEFGVLSVAFSPDNKLLATAGEGGVIRLIDRATWHERLSLKWEERTIVNLAFSSDGGTLAAGAADGQVRLWHVNLADRVRFGADKWDLISTHHEKAVSQAREGELDQAIAEFNEAIRLDPEYAQAYSNRGAVYMEKGDLEQAIADFNEAIRLDPHHVGAYTNRGRAYTQEGDLDRAMADLNEALRCSPRFSMAWNNRGAVYIKKGDLDQAVVNFNEAIRLNPTNVSAYSNRGVVYIKKGDLDKAIADLDEAIRLEPESTAAYVNRGVAYTRKGNTTHAIADLSEALRLNPNLVVAYQRRSTAYMEKGDRARAVADLGELVRLEPDRALHYNNRGYLYKLQGDLDRAIADYDQCLRLAPDFSVARSNRGSVYVKKRDFARALTDFDEVLRRDPETAATYGDRGDMYMEQGRFDEGNADFAKYVGLEPDHLAYAYYNQSLALLASGQVNRYHASCAHMLERFAASQLGDDQFWTAWTCALAPHAVDDLSAAVALANKVVRTDPESTRNLRTLGALLYRTGRVDEAITRLTEADRLAQAADPPPDFPPTYTWYFLAMAQHAAGHADQAKQWLAKAVESTEKTLSDAQQGAGSKLTWHRRLTLKLLREEAESLITAVSK